METARGDHHATQAWWRPNSARTRQRKARDRAGGNFIRPAFAILAILTCAIQGPTAVPALAQDAGGRQAAPPQGPAEGVVMPGYLVVTGFSGTTGGGGALRIDTSGASLKVLDLSGKGEARGEAVAPVPKLEVPAASIGQVFGVTLDNANPPNIYATATSAYGLHIAVPDENGDGLPDPVQTGRPGARYMEGQWGPGGGPGSVWRIDGRTGQASLLVNLENGGAGLGNITFDPTHYQLYVSDMDSGNIYRIDLAGNVLGIYDHGRTGRKAAGLEPVRRDRKARAEITSDAFDADNSDTWGLADVRRRVWGLAYHKGRLYYAVEAGPQIWSVGIDDRGRFAKDARIEIERVPGGFPVSDILFTPEGRMILAQRGGILGSTDFTQFHYPGQNRVLRYSRNPDGGWVQEPEEYAIGFPGDHRNAAGGVGLSCKRILWSTGDALRNDPMQSASLSQGGELVVHGLQGQLERVTKPRNVPPWAAWYADYDGRGGDTANAGHVGDVEVYRYCTDEKGGYDVEESWPGWEPATDWAPPPGWAPPPWWPQNADLQVNKADTVCNPDPVVPGAFLCTYTISLTNVGASPYRGTLNVIDTVPGNVEFVSATNGSIAWNCVQPGGVGSQIICDSARRQRLLPGQSETLVVTVRRLAAFPDLTVMNCATAAVPGDPDPTDNADCGWAYPPGPDIEVTKTLNACVPAPGGSLCSFWIDVTNRGNATTGRVVRVLDTLPPGASLRSIPNATSAAWTCWRRGGYLDCRLDPANIPPGDYEWLELSIFVPAGTPPGALNCAQLSGESAGDPDVNGNNSDCAQVLPAMTGPMLYSPKVSCPSGWTIQQKGWKPPKGWESRTVGEGDDAIVCGRRKPMRKSHCPRGWQRYPDEGAVPEHWTIQRVATTSGELVCARPGGIHRPPRPTHAAPVPPVVPPVMPPVAQQPACSHGEGMFLSPSDVPDGWKVREVTIGGRTIWCASKPAMAGPIGCATGERRFASRENVPPGWTVRRVSRDDLVIWCAKPGRKVVKKRCPRGKKLYKGRCISRKARRRACPRGYRRYKGRCIRRRHGDPAAAAAAAAAAIAIIGATIAVKKKKKRRHHSHGCSGGC